MPVYIKLKLPFCLYLEDGMYSVTVPDLSVSESVFIHLGKFRREKEKIDYVTFWRAELVGRGELWNDRNGTFRRSEALVILPPSVIDDTRDPNAPSVDDIFPQIIESAVKALNRLVSIYRYVTGDTYIPVIQVHEVYNTFEIGRGQFSANGQFYGTGRLGGFENRLTNTRPDYDLATHTKIRELLSADKLIPLFEEFLMIARALLEESNWRSACIEVQTAFEIFVNDKVRNYYLNQGMSNTNLEQLMLCGFVNLTVTHLPRATGKVFDRTEQHFSQWHSQTYMMRNRVVHSGYSPSAQETYDAVLGVEYALEYLINRPKEKYWPKKQPPTYVNEFFFTDNEE